jgi:hypothetical protein
MKRKRNRREREIISFICYDYCQFCDNNKCNAREAMEKYQTESLTPYQMKKVNEFQLEGG